MLRSIASRPVQRLVAPAFLAVVLSGCVSAPSKSNSPEEGRKAAETNTSLGRSYMQMGEYEIALEKLKRAIGHDKTYAPAHTVLAVLYETIGENDKAGEEYRLAQRYDPEDGDVNNNLAVYLCGQGDYRKALPHFEQAVADPFYRTPEVAYANAGLCAMQAGELDKAEVFLRKSLERDAEFSTALLPMAELNLEKGDNLRARAFLQRFESAAGQTERSLYLGYRIESALGDQSAATRYLQALKTQYPQAESLERLDRETE
jgi:type IV pilus assembly protein PilF